MWAFSARFPAKKGQGIQHLIYDTQFMNFSTSHRAEIPNVLACPLSRLLLWILSFKFSAYTLWINFSSDFEFI